MIRADRKTRRAGRLLGAASVAALAVGLLPMIPATAAVANICPGPGQTDAFTDDNGTTHEANIDCAEAYGIVNGTSATTYNPNGFLTRAQAASVLVQFAETSLGSALVDDGVNDFPDDDTSVHQPNIEKAVDNGLLQGFSDGTFGPGVLINRGQFATIAVNTVEFVLGSALTGDGVNDFDDDLGNVHEANIEKAFDNNLLVGTGTRMFSPGANVSRGQTASILIQAAGNVLFPAGAFAPANPTTNQTFTVTPAQEATNTISTSSVDDTGRRTYSADVTGATVDIALFPAENVTDTSGLVSFADVVAPANQADWTATNAVIELVNGSIAGANSGYVDNVAVPGSGTVTFAIDSQLADEVIPVLFTNAAASGAPVLALDAANEPTVAFGVGGQTNWIPAEAGSGAFPNKGVEQVNRSADSFVADLTATSNGPTSTDLTFNYDANDVFQFTGVAISMTQFEGLLTGHPSGDVVTVFYDTNPANSSTFNVGTDNVAPASNVAATAADFDADSVQDDVRITWTASSQPDAVYDVYRSANTTCTAGFPDVLVEGSSVDTTTTDLNVPAGTYTYCVFAKGATSGSLAPSAQVDNAVTPPVADTTGAHVVSEGAAVDTDAGTAGTADSGDVFLLLFDEAITSAPGATLAVTGNTGGSTNVQNGVNATFASVNGTTISVNLTQPLIGTGALTFPLTITAAAGFPDTAGNATIFGSWQDTQLETNGPEFATDTLIPVRGAQSRVVSATQIVLVFNEALAPLSVDASCSDFTIVTGACTGASASGRTVTLTGAGFVAGTTTVAINGIVNDTEGQTTTAQAATVIPAA